MPCVFNFDMFKPTPTPASSKIKITPAAIAASIKNKGWAIPMGLLDSEYWYGSADYWAEVLAKITVTYSYKDEVWDCEDFAQEAMLRASRDFGLNTLAFAIGNTPYGRHGFNVYPIPAGTTIEWWCYEPQSGFGYSYFPLTEHGYIPEKILI